MKIMPNSRKDQYPILISLLFLIVIIAPYIYAWSNGDEFYKFAGFLINPKDGNSYLAKMYQGWEGNWRFRLPYTAYPGEGAYIFIFYLLLGHISRITSIELILIFHITRILGAIAILGSLWNYIKVVAPEPYVYRPSYAIAIFGSGMGWILLPFNTFTADFWVSEAYPFLSAYTNPHFPFGLAIMLWLVAPKDGVAKENSLQNGIIVALMTLILGIISPFGVVMVLLVLSSGLVIKGLRYYMDDQALSINLIRSTLLRRLIPIMLGGVPILVYEFYIINTDKVLSAWNAQNLTLSPPLWDILISLSPFLPIALISIWFGYIRNLSENARLSHLIMWAVLGLIFLYLPINLQRRFMMGLYVPFVGLAMVGMKGLVGDHPNTFRKFGLSLFLLALPTNLIVFLAAIHGIQTHDQTIYLRREEVEALEWISNNTPTDGLILASPDMGLFIPSNTGRRVIYGHPYETANAESEKIAVTQFFRGDITQSEAKSFLMSRNVDYIFYGPREKDLGLLPDVKNLKPVYKTGNVVVMEVGD